MSFDLKKACLGSKELEFYYGAKINKKIKDAYFGMGILEPYEEKKNMGPGRGHEEILYVQEGKVDIEIEDNFVTLNEGELLFIPENSMIVLKNVLERRCFYLIAGGNVRKH